MAESSRGASKKSTTKSVYLRFTNLIAALWENENKNTRNDLTSQKLLDEITTAHLAGKTLTVSELMQLSNIGSPATLHRKMTQLIDADWLQFEFTEMNHRTKFVVPTAKANAFYHRAGKLLSQSARS
jgi:hypothetical protein